MLYPWSRSSRPMSAPYWNAVSGSHEEAAARLLGSAVEYASGRGTVRYTVRRVRHLDCRNAQARNSARAIVTAI